MEQTETITTTPAIVNGPWDLTTETHTISDGNPETQPSKTMFIYGSKTLDGFTNIGPGTAMDFNPTEPWPFEDGMADEIAFHDVLNRIPPSAVIHFVREAHRILKPFGMIDILVPVQEHPMFAGDLFQQSNIDEHTFRFFNVSECEKIPEGSMITPAAQWLWVNLSQMAHEVYNDDEGVPVARWIKLVKMF